MITKYKFGLRKSPSHNQTSLHAKIHKNRKSNYSDFAAAATFLWAVIVCTQPSLLFALIKQCTSWDHNRGYKQHERLGAWLIGAPRQEKTQPLSNQAHLYRANSAAMLLQITWNVTGCCVNTTSVLKLLEMCFTIFISVKIFKQPTDWCLWGNETRMQMLVSCHGRTINNQQDRLRVKLRKLRSKDKAALIQFLKSQSQHVSSGECHSQPNVPTVISWPAAVSLLFYCTLCPCLLTWTVTVKQIHGKISQKILSRPKQKNWETSALSKTLESRNDFIAGNNPPQAPWHYTSGS